MPSFNVKVAHDSHPSEASEKLRSFSEKVRASSAVVVTEIVEEWDEDGHLTFSFKAMGFKIAGRLESRVNEVHVTGNLPFAALPFRGAIEKEVASKIKEALS
ncbi:MAG: polyhydroxyalkanoic acid system family protein [Pirellulaceae bacterium]